MSVSWEAVCSFWKLRAAVRKETSLVALPAMPHSQQVSWLWQHIVSLRRRSSQLKMQPKVSSKKWRIIFYTIEQMLRHSSPPHHASFRNVTSPAQCVCTGSSREERWSTILQSSFLVWTFLWLESNCFVNSSLLCIGISIICWYGGVHQRVLLSGSISSSYDGMAMLFGLGRIHSN